MFCKAIAFANRRSHSLMLAIAVVMAWGPATAQEAASIIGQVVDASGGVLPGVTVVATSPSLQLERVSTVTDERGEYRLTPLPIGTYTVRYELTGFETIQREGVRLTVGFVAKLDTAMRLGSVEQSIVVSGQSPVVDVTTATTNTTFQREALEELPTTRNSILSLTQQAPGIRTTAGGFDIGGNQFTGGPALNSFGRTGDNWELLDGVLTTSAAQTNEGVYWDFSTYEEASVQTTGKTAEVPGSGVYINTILKAGGNDFHGSAFYALTGPWAESDNIDEELIAAGVSGTNELLKRYDVSGDLGGRIMRDKLWFYVNFRRAYDNAQVIGAFKPDGSPADFIRLQRFATAKVSYQINPAHKLVFLDQWNGKYNVRATSLTGWESRIIQDQVGHSRKADWTGILGDSITASAMVGYWNYFSPVYGGDEAIGKVATFDQITQRYTGESFWLTGPTPFDAEQHRYQARATLSWFKKGFLNSNHDIKAGWEYTPATYGPWAYLERESEAYYLIFRNAVPFQLATWNIPVAPTARADYVGAFAQDNWLMGRVTVNVGLRFDRNIAYNPEQARVVGPFAPEAQFPAVEFPVWNSFGPRIHAAWDLTGNVKTVLKGGWSRYNKMRSTTEVLPSGLNSLITTTYTWRDNGNRVFDPGEVNFSLSGPDFVSVAGGATKVVNGDERQPKVDELSANLEHELMQNFAVRLSAVYSRESDNRRLAGVSRPYESYSIPITRLDPGPDGVLGNTDDTGRSLTYYEYPAALRPAAFSLTTAVNDPNADSSYKAVEVSATKRSSNNWQLMAALGGIWPNRAFRTDFAALTPNAEILPEDRARRWYGKVGGSYRFPLDILAAANFNAVSGEPFQRTVSVTGGSTIPSFAVPAEAFGEESYPDAYLLDVRAEKSIRMPKGQKLSVRADVFNALNSNVITTWTTTSGPNFKRPSAIMPARIVVFSFSYTF